MARENVIIQDVTPSVSASAQGSSEFEPDPDLQSEKALRDNAIRKAYLDYTYTMAAIARYVGLHYSTVSKIIKGER